MTLVLEQQRSVFIHQLDELGETSMAQIAQTLTGAAATEIALVKVMDGTGFMAAWDRSPLAIDSLATYEQRQAEAALAGLTLLPWVVANHQNDAAAHAQFGPRLVVDLEPGENQRNYWLDSPDKVDLYLRNLRAAGVSEIYVSIDPRGWAEAALSDGSWTPDCDALLPQLYWPAFEQPWQDVLPMLDSVIAYGRPVIPIIDYRSSGQDMQAFWSMAQARGCNASSLWVMGLADSAALQNFAQLSPHKPIPVPPPAPPPVTFDEAARWQLVKYIAGGSSVVDLKRWIGQYID